jgi:predicted nucleic acid-binding protein
MPFVLDASVTASWVLEDEGDPASDVAFERIRSDPAWVPLIWWFELRNTLIVNERRGRLTMTDTMSFLQSLSRTKLHLDTLPDEGRILALARQYRLTVYDSAYLELAMREGLSLATLDRALANSARAEGVELVR